MNPLSKEEFMEKMKESEKDIRYSEVAVTRFYSWMYADYEGLVQVCAFPVPTENRDASEMGRGKWVHARTYEEFKEFCNTHSGLWRYHVYSGVNLLSSKPEQGRGDISLIDKVVHLSFDIETERGSYEGSSKEEVWWCYKYALAQAKHMKEEYKVLPLVVMSENGIHLHYKVNFDITEDVLDGKQHLYCKYLTFEAKNSKWAKKIKKEAPSHITFDQDDVSDIPRVMKVPGTLGIKSDKGRLCGIVHEPHPQKAGVILESDIEISDVDYQRMEQHSESKNKDSVSKDKVEVDAEPKDVDDSELMDRVEKLCKTDHSFREYWRGETGEYKSRSEAEYAFIIKMLKHDFSPDDIMRVMWASGMSKWEEESDHYRKRTLENAIDYFDGDVVRDSQNSSINFDKR